jgi:hypothetical protein
MISPFKSRRRRNNRQRPGRPEHCGCFPSGNMEGVLDETEDIPLVRFFSRLPGVGFWWRWQLLHHLKNTAARLSSAIILICRWNCEAYCTVPIFKFALSSGAKSTIRGTQLTRGNRPEKTRLRSTSSSLGLTSRQGAPSAVLTTESLSCSLIVSQTKGQNSRPLSYHSSSNRNRSASTGSDNLGNLNSCTLDG